MSFGHTSLVARRCEFDTSHLRFSLATRMPVQPLGGKA